MLTQHLLATDPRTPGDVLRAISTDSGLPTITALALATHPNLPGNAHPSPPLGSAAELVTVITHPDLPARLRNAYLTDHNRASTVLRIIEDYDCLTTAEIQQFHHTSPDEARSEYAWNANTPRHLAPAALAALRTVHHRPAHEDPPARAITELSYELRTLDRSMLIFTAAAIRHGQAITGAGPTPVTGPAASALYASLLTRHILAQHTDHRASWWDYAVAATADATLTRAALDDMAPRTRSYSTRERAYRTILATMRVPAHLRHEAAAALHAHAASHPALFDIFETTCADTNEAAAQGGSLDTHASVASNLATNARTLAAIAATYCDPRYHPDAAPILAAVAFHPNTPASSRQAAFGQLAEHPWEPRSIRFNRYGRYGCPDLAALASHMAATDARTLGAAPVRLISAALRGRCGHLVGPHLTHTQAARPPATLSTAVALRALESAAFAGTLRELYATTTSVAS